MGANDASNQASEHVDDVDDDPETESSSHDRRILQKLRQLKDQADKAHGIRQNPNTYTPKVIRNENASKDCHRDKNCAEDGVLEESCNRPAHANQFHDSLKIFKVFHSFLIKSRARSIT
ncbi:hypothetical protein HG530_003742 [Fusarium avenaceum]|nr:hypothetical protein HG530_003742 [Fusarium avenaceum]